MDKDDDMTPQEAIKKGVEFAAERLRKGHSEESERERLAMSLLTEIMRGAEVREQTPEESERERMAMSLLTEIMRPEDLLKVVYELLHIITTVLVELAKALNEKQKHS